MAFWTGVSTMAVQVMLVEFGSQTVKEGRGYQSIRHNTLRWVCSIIQVSPVCPENNFVRVIRAQGDPRNTPKNAEPQQTESKLPLHALTLGYSPEEA